jgi:hypothetical protein
MNRSYSLYKRVNRLDEQYIGDEEKN